MLSDRPNRHNQALAVQGGRLVLHAKDCALSTFDRAFIQQPERARKLRPGIRGLLDFHGMKLSVRFHDDVDFLGVVITVIEKVRFLACVQVRLHDLRHRIVFQDCTVHRAGLQRFRAGPLGQICHQPRVIKIQFGLGNGPF